MAHDDHSMMPREKAMADGIKSLTDLELMAILFRTGVQGKSVFELCREILNSNQGHLSLVSKMDWREFIEKYKGVGPAKALTLLAALELGARASSDALAFKHVDLSSSDKAYELMRADFFNLDHEQFWVALLNNSNRLIKKVRIGQGGLTATLVDIRLILREALLAKASGMIIFHNHPSGRLVPSSQDIKLTRDIREAADLFSIRLLDHIIVDDNSYYSFCDQGQMP